ncbi:unnamed protein product [Toxocara canis]|uniref:Uncharacterized protein n=1 Tax=Toxocara canis TaxID=6265 RepID=A0A3P7FJ17_TOXCA|nr:unnamed protein product [Toxocara canis]
MVKKANQSANDSAFITSTPRNRVVLGERNISCIHDESIDSDIASDDLPSFVTMETDGPILGPKYISFTPVRCASSNAAYQSRKNSGKIVQNHIGNLFTVSESPEEIAEEKVEVEFADTESDLASLMRFGNEKDAEEIEGLPPVAIFD